MTSEPAPAPSKNLIGNMQKAAGTTLVGGDANDYYPTVMLKFGYNFTGCGVAHKARPKYMD